MDTHWRIELLGRLRATRGKRVITRFRTQKTGALLAYLACHLDGGPVPREVLMELFWPECAPEAARASLSMALSSLRSQLDPTDRDQGSGVRGQGRRGSEGTTAGRGEPVILADHAAVQLNPAAATSDVMQFEAAVAAARGGEGAGRAQWLVQAVELYRGELLPGYFDEWVLQERQWLSECYFQALHQLLALLEEEGDRERALPYAREGVRLDPLREEAHRDLMRLYEAAGQPAAALRQYRELERVLKQQLGAAPELDPRRRGSGVLAAQRTAAGAGPRGRDTKEEQEQAIGRSGVPGFRADPTKDEHEHEYEHEQEHERRGAERHPAAGPPERPVSGVVPLDSPYYVERPVDREFRAAIEHGESIVLVKGARQVGKTSLLARGLQQAREAGFRVVLTDFQMLDEADVGSVERLYPALAEWAAFQLGLDILPNEVWKPHLGAAANFERYLQREVLEKIEAPLVWGMDEVDRLFSCESSSQVFGLFRSWHNRRGLDPSGPWSRLTLAMAYAREAYLFITDLNQSPFNVGVQLTLPEFTIEQVADLNGRYGGPLRDEGEVARFHELLGGHSYLVSRGLWEMASRRLDVETFAAQADRDEGIFGDHLRRMLVLLVKDPELGEVVRVVLRGGPSPTRESFHRLRSAGVLAGEAAAAARVRCPLYARYLERHLG